MEKDPREFKERFNRLLDESGEHGPRMYGFVFPEFRFDGHHWYPMTLCFIECQFRGPLYGDGAAEFSSLVFIRCRFHHSVRFAEVRFRDDFGFSNCVFEAKTEFWRCTGIGRVSFMHANFRSDVEISGCTFKRMDEHSHAVLFQGARFGGRTAISGLCLEGGVPVFFTGCTFLEEATLTDLYGRTKEGNLVPADVAFDRVRIQKTDDVQFIGLRGPDGEPRAMDLSRFRFAFTDVARIRFLNVFWSQPTSLQNKRFSKYKRWENQRVRDEESLDAPKDGDEPRLEPRHVASIYRGLRSSYERNLGYTEAGAFHIREMEMRRLALGRTYLNLPLRRVRRTFSLLNAYRIISLYGESYTRPLFLIIATVALFSLYHGWTGLEPEAAILRSVRNLLPSFSSFGDSWAALIERVLGVILLTFFTLALHRNFKR